MLWRPAGCLPLLVSPVPSDDRVRNAPAKGYVSFTF